VVAGRVGRKLLGLYATLGAVGAAYALFPEYAGKFYEPVWAAVRLLAPWFVVISPVYVWMVDRRQEQPEDVYAAIGAWLVRRRPVDDLAALGVHARGWLVKGFFLPLMFVYATRDLGTWIARVDGATPQRFMQVYDLLYGTGYLLDLVFTCVGYALTLRLTDTQQRSVEPTLLGWVACLVCYQPFWGVLGDRYFAYDTDGIVWGPRFAGTPWLQVAWGSAILACVGVYTWATVSFGVRFSNLSHRGIITSGPYRWLKHPAYVSKNVSWWLIAVPFLHAGSPWTAVRSCLLLLAVNGIYALRAWTEERHLAQDPTYRAYQDWIAEHGLVARLRKGWTRSSPAGTP
jgi:protein-S-isoprenylcysteine O-methyltransferase Ste14